MLLANMALVVCAPWGFHQAPGSTNRAVYVKLWSYSPFWRCTLFRRLDGLVEEERLSDVLYLGDCALEVERFGKNDLENLWTISFCMGVKAKPHTFWTLMLWLVLLNMRLAFIARAKRLACDESVRGSG